MLEVDIVRAASKQSGLPTHSFLRIRNDHGVERVEELSVVSDVTQSGALFLFRWAMPEHCSLSLILATEKFLVADSVCFYHDYEIRGEENLGPRGSEKRKGLM